MSLSMNKRFVRTTLLQQRERLSCDEIGTLSQAAQTRLLGLPAFKEAGTLALYSPIRGEVETDKLLVEALAAGKRVCYPLVSGDQLQFFEVHSPADLQVGCFGICEPDSQAAEILPSQLDLLLVPGVAFDRCGHRLGYGRGYFDRLLKNAAFSGLSVGFCYEFQVHEELPVEEHDQPVALLVTNTQVFSPL